MTSSPSAPSLAWLQTFRSTFAEIEALHASLTLVHEIAVFVAEQNQILWRRTNRNSNGLNPTRVSSEFQSILEQSGGDLSSLDTKATVFLPNHVPQNGVESVLALVHMLYDELASVFVASKPKLIMPNGRNWILAISESGCYDRLVNRHAQLRAFYGMMHLAKLLMIELVEAEHKSATESSQQAASEQRLHHLREGLKPSSSTLYLDTDSDIVMDSSESRSPDEKKIGQEESQPEIPCKQEPRHVPFLFVAHALKPQFDVKHWRGAVNMDAFFGRYFGFQYRLETRECLRATLVARSTIQKAVETSRDDPISRTIAMMGWGWVYSNMTVLNQMGLSIDQVSQIGQHKTGEVSLEQARLLWNLPEMPLLTSAGELLGSEVAIDKVIRIPLNSDMLNYLSYDAALSTADFGIAVQNRANRPSEGATMDEIHGTNGAKMPNPSSRGYGSVAAPAAVSARTKNSWRLKTESEENMVRCRILSALWRPFDVPGFESMRIKPEKGLRGNAASTLAALVPIPVTPQPGGSLQKPAAIVQNEVNLGESLSATTADDHMQSRGSLSELPKSASAALPPRPPALSASVVSSPPPVIPPEAQPSGFAAIASPMLPKAASAALASAASAAVAFATGKGGLWSPGGAPRSLDGSRPIDAGESVRAFLDGLNDHMESFSATVDSFLRPGGQEPANALMIYFHGGGFIAQSSSGHALYLREWAAQLEDAVILAVDYKLAPEYKFPVAVEEGVYVYEWAVRNLERLGTRGKRVVIAGDSAGGNIALAITFRLIERKSRVPDGLVLAYPALYLSPAWSASRLLSFFDPMLPSASLELCLKSYIPEGVDSEKNYYLSPCIAPVALLEALPPVVAVSGSFDPLFDDLVYFANLLKSIPSRKEKRDIFHVAHQMPHGFLHLHMIDPQSRKIVNWMAREIRRMMVF